MKPKSMRRPKFLYLLPSPDSATCRQEESPAAAVVSCHLDETPRLTKHGASHVPITSARLGQSQQHGKPHARLGQLPRQTHGRPEVSPIPSSHDPEEAKSSVSCASPKPRVSTAWSTRPTRLTQPPPTRLTRQNWSPTQQKKCNFPHFSAHDFTSLGSDFAL